MEFDEIQTMWRSPHNTASAASMAAQQAELVRRLRRRYRSFLITIGAGIASLLVCVAALVRFALRGGTLDPTVEWGALLLFALPVVGAGVLLSQYRRHRARHASYQSSISASLRAALDENRLARTRIKIIAALYGGMVLVFPVIIYQLRAAGKARPSEVSSMIALFAGLVIVVSVCLAHHYRRRLLPTKHQLEELLGAYESDPARR